MLCHNIIWTYNKYTTGLGSHVCNTHLLLCCIVCCLSTNIRVGVTETKIHRGQPKNIVYKQTDRKIFSHVHIVKYVDPNYILQCPESCETPCIAVKAEKVLSLLRFQNILNSTCFVIYFIIVLAESRFSPSGCFFRNGFLGFYS